MFILIFLWLNQKRHQWNNQRPSKRGLKWMLIAFVFWRIEFILTFDCKLWSTGHFEHNVRHYWDISCLEKQLRFLWVVDLLISLFWLYFFKRDHDICFLNKDTINPFVSCLKVFTGRAEKGECCMRGQREKEGTGLGEKKKRKKNYTGCRTQGDYKTAFLPIVLM